jgi:hypothetical protein
VSQARTARSEPFRVTPSPRSNEQGISGCAFSCSTRKPQIRLTSSPCRTPPGQKTAHPPGSSRDPHNTPVSTSSLSVSTRQQRFTYVRLPDPHLTPHGRLFLIAHHNRLQPTQHEAVWSYEDRPEARPFSRDELQRFFNYADDQVERAQRAGRKGALAAYRDATLFKVIYGWGLRRTEASKLDLVDFGRNPKAPQLGRFGMLIVRYGKAKKGQPPRAATCCR